MEKRKLIIEDVDGTEYEVAGGGDIAPVDSVNSASIVDSSIKKEDLSPEVQDGLDELNNINLTDEDMERWFDDDPNNDDPEE